MDDVCAHCGVPIQFVAQVGWVDTFPGDVLCTRRPTYDYDVSNDPVDYRDHEPARLA